MVILTDIYEYQDHSLELSVCNNRKSYDFKVLLKVFSFETSKLLSGLNCCRI